MAGDRRARNFFLADAWVYCGVELHLAVDKPFWMIGANFFNNKIDFFEVVVFAATTFGGIGKHSDARSGAKVEFVSFRRIFDDDIELVGRRMFIDTAIGNDDGIVVTFADKTAREKW